MECKIYKDMIYPILILLAICLVVTFFMALTNYFTAQKIADNRVSKDVIKKIFRIASDNFLTEQITESCFKIKDSGGHEIGYIFLTEDKGYGGTLTLMTGISKDGAVAGLQVISSGETPGLGKKCEEEPFLGQFVKDEYVDSYEVVKNPPENPREVQAVTGATISSGAVTRAVNKAVEDYRILTGGGKNDE